MVRMETKLEKQYRELKEFVKEVEDLLKNPLPEGLISLNQLTNSLVHSASMVATVAAEMNDSAQKLLMSEVKKEYHAKSN